jgi:hypothetical protein
MTGDLIVVATLKDAPPDTFMIYLGTRGLRGVERAMGPFSEEECRVELGRLGVPPAAIEARIERGRKNPR